MMIGELLCGSENMGKNRSFLGVFSCFINVLVVFFPEFLGVFYCSLNVLVVLFLFFTEFLGVFFGLGWFGKRGSSCFARKKGKHEVLVFLSCFLCCFLGF